MANVRDILNDALKRLSQVPGASVQQFSQEKLLVLLNERFNIFFDEYEWPAYCTNIVVALDGTLGISTTPVADWIPTNETAKRPLRAYEHIISILPEQSEKALTARPANLPPSRITGTRPEFYEYNVDETRIFRVLPVTATGNINENYQAHPGNLVIDGHSLLEIALIIL